MGNGRHTIEDAVVMLWVLPVFLFVASRLQDVCPVRGMELPFLASSALSFVTAVEFYYRDDQILPAVQMYITILRLICVSHCVVESVGQTYLVTQRINCLTLGSLPHCEIGILSSQSGFKERDGLNLLLWEHDKILRVYGARVLLDPL